MSNIKEREQKARKAILNLDSSTDKYVGRHSYKEIASLAHVDYATAECMCRRMKGFVREDGSTFVGGQYGEYRWKAAVVVPVKVVEEVVKPPVKKSRAKKQLSSDLVELQKRFEGKKVRLVRGKLVIK